MGKLKHYTSDRLINPARWRRSGSPRFARFGTPLQLYAGPVSQMRGWSKPFVEGLVAALHDFKVPMKVDGSWTTRSGYIIVAVDEQHHVVGGARLECAADGIAMPLEKIMQRIVETQCRAETVELANVWVASTYRKSGLSDWLVHFTTAYARLASIRQILLLGHAAVRPLYERHGWHVDAALAPIAYPSKVYNSRVMRLHLVHSMPLRNREMMPKPSFMTITLEGLGVRQVA